MSGAGDYASHLDDLLEEHGYIPSVDVCAWCSDSECDGIGHFSDLDANDEADHPTLERLHELLRKGQAWDLMSNLIDSAGEAPLVAVMLAQEVLAVAENRTMPATCDGCGREFNAQTPCDETCTACRLAAAS